MGVVSANSDRLVVPLLFYLRLHKQTNKTGTEVDLYQQSEFMCPYGQNR